MSATPHTTGGVPDGTEAISDIQSLSLAIMNQAGQVIETDAYYNLPSLSGDVASGVVGTDNILNGLYAGTQWTPGTAPGDANYYSTTYAYDAYGNLDREENPDGTITRTVYDSLGRAASEWVGTDDTTGSYSGFYWSPANSASIGNMVETTSYQYDDGGVGDSNLTQVISFESEDGSTTITPEVSQYFYDWQDRLVAEKDGVLLTNYHQAAGDEQTYVEDTSGETSSPTSQLPITYYTLDNLGEVTQEAVYNGNGVTLSYSSGVPQAPTTGGVSATDYAFDAQGRLYQTTPCYYSGGAWVPYNTIYQYEVTYLKFDGDGNVVTTTDPSSNVTSYSYDRANRETSMSLPNASTGAAGGPTTAYGYDADGNLTSVTDAMSNVTTYDFDAAGRETAEYLPVASTGASGGPETSYAFDADGNLETLTDPDGNTTTYSYDALGRETGTSEEIAEDSMTTVTAATADVYDGDNNLLETIDADGRANVYTYNDLDQQTEEQWYATSSLGTATNTIATSYDLDGNVLTSVDTYPTALDAQDSSYTFTYNTLGQQITADNNGSGATGTTGTAGVPDVVLDSTYDANSDRLSLAAAVAGTADFENTYTYDALGNESTVTRQGVSGGNAVAPQQGKFYYDGDYSMTESAGYGGSSFSYMDYYYGFGYDHEGDLTSVYDQAHGSSSYVELESMSMSYNAAQELTGVTNSIHTAENQTYSYDHDGQLTSGGASYSYDSNGNIAGSGTAIGDGNAQLAADGYTYTYDAAGNTICQTNTSTGVEIAYTYDNRSRLTSVTTLNSSTVIQQVVTYTYDAFNQLNGESVTPYSGGVAGGTTTQRFVYDMGTGEMSLAFNSGGSITDRFLWGPIVDQILADEKVTSLGSAGTLEFMALNNVGNLTDAFEYGTTPTVLDHVVYDAFGGITSQTDSTYAPLFGHNGVYTDPATGLEYHNDPATGIVGRWYDPRSQRWLTQDPIFPLSGSNPYEYCGNSPTNNVDPSGLSFWGRVGGAFQAIGGIAEGLTGFALATVSIGGEVGTLGASTPLSVAGVAGGSAMVLQGSDLAGAGLHDLFYGGDPPAQTLESRALQQAGMNRSDADTLVNGSAVIANVAAGGSMMARRMLPNACPLNKFSGMTSNALNKTISAQQHVLLRQLFNGGNAVGLSPETLEAAAELSRRALGDVATTAAQRAKHLRRLAQIAQALNEL
jgi:RHS repeat-associated protein